MAAYRADAERPEGMEVNALSRNEGVTDITCLLQEWRGGDMQARDRLLQVVYGQVHAISCRAIRANPRATLSPTDLAHEALLRLLGKDAPWENRRHFYHVIALATRQVLVDSARKRLRNKRGGGALVESLGAADAAAVGAEEKLLYLNQAIEQLARHSSRCGQIVELTYFGGLERDEVATALDISVATVDRELRFARA
ncbi:MAG: RNA polymerase subunit sigma-70 [Xanthomonadales bacterium]|nr:RNA polymerase subunit sigma-70 [Xanthomonadales bacterium]